MVLSAEPLAINLKSEEIDTQMTSFEWPDKQNSCFLVKILKTFIWLSWENALPEALIMYLPSFETVIEFMSLLCL